jgi:dihydroneopterin aldolase
MQILANTDEHVDAVPDLVERVRNEILKSLSRFSQRVTRVEVHLSDQNADRRGNEFTISQATGRVASAFRRASFEVTAWDGRPLSCRGSRG